jgi:hypothetical protein
MTLVLPAVYSKSDHCPVEADGRLLGKDEKELALLSLDLLPPSGDSLCKCLSNSSTGFEHLLVDVTCLVILSVVLVEADGRLTDDVKELDLFLCLVS